MKPAQLKAKDAGMKARYLPSGERKTPAGCWFFGWIFGG